MAEISDKFGRTLKYLRISVTDRCNFRCKYCMPNNDFSHIEHENILSYEDILFIAETFAQAGVNRIRVTGGEPLVRAGICDFLGRLTKIQGIEEVMLTTNGSLLNKYADDLAKAGIKRLNISLDSMKLERNKFITGVDKDYHIIDGIKKAKECGLNPIKVNSVIIRDFNDDEVVDFAKLSADLGIICRFIEFMPIGNSDNWNEKSIVKGEEILERLKDFEPVEMKRDRNTGPAVNYKLNNGGVIGLITPMSHHFCSDCDKLRLTSDGKIRPCLLSDKELDLVPFVKNQDRNGIIELITEGLNMKNNDHNITSCTDAVSFQRTMSKIGG